MLLERVADCCLSGKYGKIGQASGRRWEKTGNLAGKQERRFSRAFQIQKGQKMGLSDNPSFQAGCRGFESHLPLQLN